MKFKGTIIGEASGSLASMVFSHNRGGQYIRQRTIPTNPNSTFQQTIRSLVAALTSVWNNVLTAAQRAGWDTYAENVQLLDVLGETRNVGGLGMFIRANTARLQTGDAGLPIVADAPTTFNLGELTPPNVISATAATEALSIGFTNTDEWANEDGGALLIYGSRPQNGSVNFFKGPYRYAGLVLGDGTTPPISPASITNPFPFAVGNKVFIRAIAIRADGRVSATFRDFGTGA